MKLSDLVYLCVKNSLLSEKDVFNKEDFLLGKWDGSADYGIAIENVFTPLNEAISRLNDLNKIPYAISTIFVNGNVVDISDLFASKVYNVALVKSNGYSRLPFTPIGNKSLILTRYLQDVVYVEYKVDIPTFDRNYIPSKDSNGELTTTDVDLAKDYGITNNMCQYIIEYVFARLYETTDINVSNLHITRSEQYFANIDRVQMAFPPKNVSCKIIVGE